MPVSTQVVGVATASFSWQDLSKETNAELFRVSQVFGDSLPGGYILLAQRFPDQNAYYGVRRIYPGREPFLIDMKLPELFLSEGIEFRRLAIKYGSLFRSTLFTPWTLTVSEVFAVP